MDEEQTLRSGLILAWRQGDTLLYKSRREPSSAQMAAPEGIKQDYG
jgi:hypothetical protein